MAPRLTTGMRAALAIELVVALLFLIFGLGETYRNAVGRPPAVPDILAASLPLILVIAAIFVAAAAARRGNIGNAWVAVLAPFPIALVLAMLGGTI